MIKFVFLKSKGKLNVKTFQVLIMINIVYINGVFRALIKKHFILAASEYRYLTNIGHYHDCND